MAGGATQLTLPANSLTLLVVPAPPPGDATAPAAPTGLTATAGDGQATVTWTAPADGGSPITSYTVTAHHDGTDGPTTTGYGYPPAPHATLTGLTNGTAYTVTVTATNAVDTGMPSEPSAPVTPIGKPAAPTGVTARAGDGSATVSWTPPADTGGIPDHRLHRHRRPRPHHRHHRRRGDQRLVPGLTNGTPYTFTVTATNTVGAGPKSAPTSPHVIPATSPDQVVRVTIDPDHNPSPVGGPVKFTVAVTKGDKPATPGAVALWDDTAQHYAAYDCPLDTPSQSATATTNTCTATFEEAGTHQLIASWDVFWPEGDHGQSPPYSQQVGGEPSQPTPPATPTNVTAQPGDGQATVTWTAPTDGGSPITSYQVTAHHDGTDEPAPPVTGTPPTTTTTVHGLTNGTAYTFTVTATNTAGTGPASAPSPPVTPATLPAAPTDVSATAGDRQATVTWTAPADTGGSPITGYTVTAHHAGTDGPTRAATATTATLDGLSNGTAYTFTVTATNTAGTGPASAPSPPVTPATRVGAPAAPTGVTATAGDGSATVSWTAPADTGGSPITGYTVTAHHAGTDGPTRAATATTATLDGLSNGTAYTFTVTASNAAGTGPASAPSPPVTPGPSDGAPHVVILDSRPNPSPLGGTAQVTVAVSTGEHAAEPGAVSIWDETAAHYLAYGCPLDTPSQAATAATYTCTGTFDTPGPHQLTASYDVFWPVAWHGQSPPYTQQVDAEPPQPTPPAAPTNVTATVVGALATVTWTAPPDGGSPITSYQVIAHHDGRNEPQELVTGTPPIPRIDVRLSPGTAYTFTVLATNAVGTSPASAPSPPVSAQPPPAVAITSKPANPTDSRTGTVEFTVSRPTATTCQLDSARPVACTSPVSYTDLAEGGHRVTVTATDTSGSGSATGEWTVDLTPPTVTLTARPPAITNSRTATFGFTVNEPAFISCKLDNDNRVWLAVSCYSPRSYTNLTAGRHTVTITATDTAGNRAAPAVVSWTVDLTAPTMALTAPATGATTNRTATVKWTGTDAPAGIAGYDLSMQRYTLAGKPEPVSYPLTNTPRTATTLTLTAGKTTCLRVRAHDRAGNTSAWTPSRCVSVPADERALTASTGWTRVAKTGYYTDTYTWTARAGATMTTPTTKVAKAWLVATRCPGCGTVGIYLGTTQVGTVNLNAVTAQRAAILPAYAGIPRSGLLTLKVLTNGRRVELDGLALAPQ